MKVSVHTLQGRWILRVCLRYQEAGISAFQTGSLRRYLHIRAEIACSTFIWHHTIYILQPQCCKNISLACSFIFYTQQLQHFNCPINVMERIWCKELLKCQMSWALQLMNGSQRFMFQSICKCALWLACAGLFTAALQLSREVSDS